MVELHPTWFVCVEEVKLGARVSAAEIDRVTWFRYVLLQHHHHRLIGRPKSRLLCQSHSRCLRAPPPTMLHSRVSCVTPQGFLVRDFILLLHTDKDRQSIWQAEHSKLYSNIA